MPIELIYDSITPDTAGGVSLPALNRGGAGMYDVAAFRADLGFVLDGTADDGPRLALLAARVADEGGRIRLADPLRINASMTLGVGLEVRPGALVRPAAGVTLTLAGPVDAGHVHWIDESLGGKVRFAPGSIEALNPVHWGAPVNGVDNDGPAVRAAGLNAMATGIRVQLISGYWVIGSPNTSELVWMDGATHSVTIQGAGVGITNIKRPDNSIPDPGLDENGVQRRSLALRLFYVRNAAGHKITVNISGLTIDDNHRGNPFFAADPEGLKRQQTHCIEMVANGDEGIAELRVRDVAVHDCNTDGLKLGTMANSAFGDIFVDGFRETGRARKLRSGLCATGGFKSWHISNTSVDNLEFEFNQTNLAPSRVFLSNVLCRYKFDANVKKTIDTGVIPELYASNLRVTGKMNTGQMRGKFKNCRFVLNEPWRVQEYEWRFEGNCEVVVRHDFTIPAGTSTGGVLYALGNAGPDVLDLGGVEFSHDKYREADLTIRAQIVNPLPLLPDLPVGTVSLPVPALAAAIPAETDLFAVSANTWVRTRGHTPAGATRVLVYRTTAPILPGDAIQQDGLAVATISNPLPAPASVAIGATALPVAPLLAEIPAGKILKWGTGVYAETTGTAPVNATSIPVGPVTQPIFPSDTAIEVTLFDPAAAGVTCYVETSVSSNSPRREVKVEGCRFRGNVQALRWRGGVLSLDDNDFESVSNPAVYVLGGLPADFANRVHITNNRMHASQDMVLFPVNLTDVADIWMKGNVNTVAPLRLANLRETNVLVRGTSAAGGLTFHELDVIVFGARPTTGRWLIGQIILYPAPTGSHALGEVCITPGPSSNNTAKWDVIGSPALSTSTVTRRMATAGTTAEQYLLAGATQPTFQRRQDGQQKFGAGGSTAPDVTIDRMGPGTIRQTGASKGSAAYELRAENDAGDPVAGDIEFRGTDRGSIVFRLLAAVAGAIRFVALRMGTDRDGNRLGFGIEVTSSVTGANTRVLSLPAGYETGSVIPQELALATDATAGFQYVRTCAGAPTGVPVAHMGCVPMLVDSASSRVYFYVNGAWRYTQLA
ncbi:hypothetical protein [Longimicrobium sp.]|jgi:hypothetical protein|uniref:hypothetical protein n=1 Tax=Longimicrobium sp. TaxID=2029185 RepID=UPI002EDB7DAB